MRGGVMQQHLQMYCQHMLTIIKRMSEGSPAHSIPANAAASVSV